jgi:hypothetical protein
MPTTTYGPFTFDGISVQGPKDYLEARGLALLDAILSGEDQGFDPGGYPDEETARRSGQRTCQYLKRNPRPP